MRIGFGIALYKEGWVIELVDIEAAFLEGNLARHMFLEWPEGMVEMGFITEEERRDCCILLSKGMYGNHDASLRFFLEYKRLVMSKPLEMEQSKTDPCVFYKKDKDGKLVLLAMPHVDDTCLVGEPEWAKKFKQAIKSRFNYTDLGQAEETSGSVV